MKRPVVTAAPDPRRTVLACAVGLAALVIVLYWRAVGNQFVNLDDDTYVYLNAHLKGVTFDALRWAFTDIGNGNWHPVTWLSHMLDVQWFGLAPAGHHFVSVFWHAANSAVLLAALWYMTGRLWRSVLVAALFAFHPLRVESVAWVAERKDVLSSFFYLGTIWAYAWYTRRPQSFKRYAAVAALLSLGLMSKASVVTAPFVLLLLDYWPLRRKQPLAVLVREKIPLFVLAAAVSVATFIGQRQAGATRGIEDLSLAERLANAVVSYARYLGKTVWPHPLAALYPYDRDLSALKVAAALLLLAAITALVWWRRRESPYLLVGWFWFLGTLVPMIGLVQVGWQAYADRYTYIPSIGLFIAVVWLVADANWKREPVIGAAVVILGAFAFLTWSQIPYWSDDLTLFQHAIEVTSANPFAQYHVGDDLVEAGRIAEAVPHLEEAIRLRPNFAAAYFTLGKAQAVEGQNQAALQNFSQAVRIAPDFAKAYYSRALTYLKDGQIQPAELDFRAALQHGLDIEFSPDAHNTLGVILAQRGQMSEAIAQFTEAVRLRPDLVVAQRNLAMTLAGQGRTDEAITGLVQALSITHDPDLIKMLHDLRGQ